MENKIKTETQKAIEHLSKELKADAGFWYSWQSNIAMCFHDEMIRRDYRFPDLLSISNSAAITFLQRLTGDKE